MVGLVDINDPRVWAWPASDEQRIDEAIDVEKRPRQCDGCGVHFLPPRPRSRFCSTHCANKSRRMQPRNCEYCGVLFTPQKSVVRYCSITCSSRGQTQPAEVRFWRKVNRNGPEVWEGHGPCWEWTASRNEWGYGQFAATFGHSGGAHIYSYQLHHGSYPAGLEIDHLCKNRACVRPDHLEAVTPRVNTLRSNAVSALNARKTHCPKGHPYDEENTRIGNNGGRYCRACAYEYQRLPVNRERRRTLAGVRRSAKRMRQRTLGAIDVAWAYSSFAGEGAARYVVDQMLRVLLGPDDYDKFVAGWEASGEQRWDRGMLP